MGNIPSADLSKTDADFDKEILGLQTSAFFNDKFISGLVEKLPMYGFPDTQSSTGGDSSATNTEEAKTNENEQRLEKFMTIFSSDLSGCSKVEDFPILSVDKSLANSGFSVMSSRRSRLLIRLFQAYSNQLNEIKSAASQKNKNSGAANGLYWQLPLDGEKGHSASEEEILSNLSLNMSLTLARAFGNQNPPVVKAILQTLLDGLVLYKPLSFRTTPGLEHTLNSIRAFAAEMLTINADPEVKALALSLQMTMGLLVGSVMTVIQSIEMLGQHDLVLCDKVLDMIEKCIQIPADFDISFPNTKNPHDKFALPLEIPEDKKSLKTIPQMISITCDGTFYYLYDGFARTLSKIGSGLNGTIPGEIVCVSKPLASLVRELDLVKEKDTTEKEDSVVENAPTDDRFLLFSRSKKSELITLRDGDLTAINESDDDGIFRTVLIDQVFPAQNRRDFVGRCYFEITVEAHPDDAPIAIGWSYPHFQLDGEELLGWIDGTYAFHSDGEFHGSGTSSEDDSDREEPSWNEGDVIGCGIDYNELKVFFTYNGHVIAKPFSLANANFPELYPAVTMDRGCCVSLNTGQRPFRYSGSLVTGPMMGSNNVAGKPQAVDKSHLLASLTVSGSKLYAHFNQGLDSRSVAMFHTANLEYAGLLDLTNAMQTQTSSDSKDISASSVDEVFSFEIDPRQQDVLNIRATKGYTIEIVEAFLGDIDVVDILEDLRNSSGNSIFTKSIREAFFSTTTEVLRIKCKAVPKEANRLCLPIASADNTLFVIEETNGSSSSAKRVYDAIKEIQFSSATAGAPSRDDFDVLPIVQQLWLNYLGKLHKQQLKAGDVNSFQEDFKTIFAAGTGESPEEENQQESTEGDESEKKTSRLNISFVFSDNQKSSINFTENCQWDLILGELEDVLDHRTPAFNALSIQLGASPAISARYPLFCRGYDSLKADLLDSSSLLCNGHQLMVVSPSLASSDTVRARAWKFSLDKIGEIQRFYNKKFVNKGCGTPMSFCFDVRNNIIIGFDTSSLSVLKWRNAGFSPSTPTIVESEKDPLLDSSSTHRLQLLWQQFKATKEAKLQVAILLSLLDKLSEPYGGNDLSGGDANIDALNQVKLTAKWTASSSEKNRCVITIRDNLVEFDDDGEDDKDHEGYHIVVLNKHTFSVEKTRWFNNEKNQGTANRMGDFLNDLEEGSIVLLANAGNVHDNMGRYTIEALMNYGACDLETVERCRGLVMIGIKGLKPGTADYAFGESGEVVKLLRFLPPRAIPLKLEPSPDALVALLKLNKQLFAAAQSQGDVFSHVCFSSALRLLQVNLYNFTHRSKPEDALKSFEGERSREVKEFLEKLMSSSLMDIPIVRTASVGLFFASLALVFPRTEDQVVLFDTYAKKYQNGSISEAELSLLQVLLRRFLKANDLISLSKNGKLEYTNILRLIEVVQLIIAQETKGLVQHALSAQVDAVENPIYAAAVQLLTSLSKSVLAFAAEPLIKGSDILSSSSLDIARIFQVVSIVSKLSCSLLQNIVDFKNKHQEITLDTACVLTMLQRSPVGSILPITTITVSDLVRSWGYKFISASMESVLGAINDLDECLAQMNSVLSLLSPEASQYDDSIPQAQSSSKVFESEHPYRSNMDERTIISFPGALGVTITFDSKSRTEHSCDYVMFQDRNGSSLHPHIDRLSGRDGNENWPGFGNRPPLTINSNDFVCYFRSDGSVEDWGYKFTVTANYPLKVTSTNRFNWLAKLSFELVQSLSLIGAGMMQGTPWNEDVEKSCEGWMENPLVKPEYFSNPNHDTILSSDADKFLHGLFDRKTNTVADKFLRKIRLHVPEDQGTIDVVNRAVYATCAAIMRGNNLTAEAMAFANGTISDPSPALIKAWRAGQKMRSYFILNDVKVSMSTQAPQSAKSKLQSSIYAGAPEEVIKAASEAVITRAKFLLRSASKASSAGESAETTVATDATPPNLSLLGPTLPSEPSHGSESTSPEKSADGSPVNKWSLATKAIKLQRQVSHETKNVQAMWHSLVDEVVVLDKLKNVFLQRRKFVEKSKVSKELTLTEKILNFVQSDVDINKLHDVNLIRNKRAIVRSKGFDVFTRLLHEKSSPFAIFITTTTYINALTKFRRQDGNNSENLHFAHSLEGCSPEQNQLLWQKFFSFLTTCVGTILRSYSSLSASVAADVGVWEKALVNVLRACAMDYDVTDHQTIYESDIVTVLEQILRGKASTLVKQTANALLEIIVSRFIVFDSSSETGEPTELNKSLISMLAKLLAESKKEISTSSASASASASPSLDSSLTDMVSPLLAIDELIVVRSMAGGRAIPHFDLPLDHTLSFSVGREKSSIDSVDLSNILPGSRVMRSIYWKEDKARSDGGLGVIGVITGVIENGKKVSVKWPHGKEFVYTIGLDNSDSEAKPEVVLADPQLAGALFSKGSSIVADDEELKKTTPLIMMMSGHILADGTLLITYEFSDKTLVHIRTKERIPPSKWVHFAISTDCQSRLSLYIDGKCVQSEQIPSVKTCGSASLSLNNSNETYELPTIDSAASFVVWMEEVSAFPAAGINVLVQSGDNVQKMVNFGSEADLPGKGSAALRLNDAQSSLCVMPLSSDEALTMNAAVRGISAADAQSLAKSTTRLPWYIGHPSAYQVLPLPVAPYGTNILLREFTVFGTSLSAPAIRHLASMASERASFEEEDARKTNEIPVLDVLGVLRRSLSNLDNLAESPMRRCFANCGIVTMLFEQFASTMPNIRVAAYQLASHIFPAMDIELIDGNGVRAQLYAQGETFLGFLCGEIGRGFNTWRQRARAASQFSVSLQFSDADLHAIISAQLLLLRSFSMGRKEWQERFSETLKTLVDSAIDTLPHLKSAARNSFALPTTWDESHLAIADRIFSLLAIIGGTPVGKFGPGSRVSYIDENTGMAEPAIVLGPAVIPPIDNKNKDSLKRWSFAKNFGDAVAILLDSDPKNSLVVPVHTLMSTFDNTSVPARVFELLKEHIGAEKLIVLFQELISIDLSDPRPKRGPIEVVVEEEKVFESEHPYPNNKSHYETITFEGTEKIEIIFDEQSRTEDGCDFVLFYKDNNRKSTYGEKYMGRNGNENFPGFGGREPLIISGSSAVLHFYSDSSGNDWGYKFTAKAKCRKQVFPPELPPVPNQFLLSNLKMLGMKAVVLMTRHDWVLESLVALLPQIIQSALSPKPETTVMANSGSSTDQLMFESTHPYADCMDQYTPVHVPGATRFIITFDPETRTENNCDYLIFYTDDSHTTKVPDSETYSGGKDGSSSNWPGINGKPPLVIEGDSFVYFFHSDSSVNDWGFRMNVIVEKNSPGSSKSATVRGAGMDALQAETFSCILQGLLNDGVGFVDDAVYSTLPKFAIAPAQTSVPPFISSLKKTYRRMEESKEEDEQLIESKTDDDDVPVASLGAPAQRYDVSRVNHPKTKLFTTVSASDVHLFSEPNKDSTKLETLSVGQKLIIHESDPDASSSDVEWLKAEKVSDFESESSSNTSGWITRRAPSGDLSFAVQNFGEEIIAELTDEQLSIERKSQKLSDNKSKGQEYRNPMYCVENGTPGAANGTGEKLKGNTIRDVDVVGRDYLFIDQAIAEYNAIAAINYANQGVAKFLENWPDKLAFTDLYFGSADNLLSYLNVCLADLDMKELFNTANKSNKAAGVRHLLDVVIRDAAKRNTFDDHIPGVIMLRCAQQLLEDSTVQPTEQLCKPVKRGKRSSIESAHPYDHNLNQDWPISFPSAKKLELSFTDMSATETNYDYITIYTDSSKSTKAYSEKIHGYRNATQRHWPGVNVPPIIIDGSSCVVNFTTDGGTNDWGFKLDIFAVYEEPSEAEIRAYTSNLSAPTQSPAKLALLIFHYFATQFSVLSPLLRHVLFTIENFRSLIKFFNSPVSSPFRAQLLDIFVVFTSAFINDDSHAGEILRELSELEKSLVGYANEQYAVETNKGARTQGATPELQSSVQMIITLQAAISSIRARLSENDTKTKPSLSLKPIPADSPVNADPAYRTLYNPESTNSKSVIVWEIQLKRVADLTKLPFVGIVTDMRSKRPASCHVGHSSAVSTEVSLSGSSVFVNGTNIQATKCKQWSEGDVVVMQLDRLNGTLEYSLNGASLPLIIGPPAKTPLFEMNIIGIDCFLAVSLANPEDEVEVRYLDKSSPNVAASGSSSSLDWLQPVREVQSILQSIANRKIPESIISTKFLPFCNKKSTVHWQLSSEDFASSSEFEKELSFPSASQISIVVEESALQNCDVIEFFNRSGDLLLAICGDAFTVSNVTQLTPFINKVTARSVERSKSNSTAASATRARLAAVGDKVTRGPRWEFGNEDGGLGSVGEVIKAHVIGNKPPTMVVRWPNGVEASYLNSNVVSSQVVTIFETALSANASSSFHRAADGSFTFAEEYVKMRIQCSAKSSSTAETEAASSKERKLSLYVIPCLSAAHCFQNPSFQAFHEYLSSLYVVKNRAALSSFVKHINKVAREKSLSPDELLRKRWADVSPSAQDLTRSAVLKELFDFDPFALSEEEVAVINEHLIFARTKPVQAGESSAAAVTEETEEEEQDGAPEGEIQLSDPHRGFYLSEYASWGGIHEFESLEFALMAARQVYPACQGITQEGRESFTLRAGNVLLPSPSGETSWLLVPPPQRKKRKVVAEEATTAAASEEIHAISSEIADEAVSLRSSRSASVASATEADASANTPTAEDTNRSDEVGEDGPDEETATVIDEELHDSNEDGGDSDDEGYHSMEDLGSDNNSNSDREEVRFWPTGTSSEEEESNDDDDDDDDDEEEDSEDDSAHIRRRRPTRRVSSEDSDPPIRLRRVVRTPLSSSSSDTSDAPIRLRRRSPLTALPEPVPDNSDEMCTPVPVVAMPCCAKCSKSLRLHPAGTWGEGWSCDWREHEGPNSFTRADPVHGCDTIGPCNWGVCVKCWDRIVARGKAAAEELAKEKSRKNTLNANMRPIEAHFDLLVLLNSALIKALPLIDLTRKEKIPGTLSHLISSNRDLIFEVVKKKPFDEAVSATTGSGSQFDLFLSRFRARKNATAGKVDTDGRWSVFSQAFRVMHSMNPSTLRRSDKLYNTKFMGEHAQDAGGPYRESFDNYAEELQSPVLPLFIRTPNGRHAVGYNREKWILNPNATSSVQLEMLAFVGKLMGIAIRSKEYMSLNIPSFIWKLIAGDAPAKEDLEGIDFSLVNSLDLLRNIDKTGVDEVTFSSTFFETFTTTSSDDRVVELVAGGKDIDVTFDNRQQYCDLVMQYRLHEFDKQAAAIREGLATIIPTSLLSMFRWDELEEMVCGKPDIDIKLLESVAEYSSCQPTDAHIRLFWQAMEEFNNEERSAFIKFTWGRSRLPLNATGFTQRFKLQSFDKNPPDNYLPVAHTCFFSLELPRYSSLEIMKEKLRYAIFNCQAIDGDETSTGMTVAAMGWEEEE